MLGIPFTALQPELKDFYWSPHVHALVSTFWLQGTLSPGWGITEEKGGKFITDMVILGILVFFPNLPAIIYF